MLVRFKFFAVIYLDWGEVEIIIWMGRRLKIISG